jgi:hypothetical protein
MQAHKQKVTVPEDHQLEIRLPEDFPSGPAEIIILAGPPESRARDEAQHPMRDALEALRAFKPTEEEERVLGEFEEFRQRHPFDLSSLVDEDR